jgi:hypothetical protein
MLNRFGLTLQEYIDSKVAKDLVTGCWIWGAPVKEKRYGNFMFPGITGVVAHIAVFKHYGGIIPEGLILRHSCDTPRCVNPDHLLPGTKKDNRQDFMRRHPRAMELCLAAAKSSGGWAKRWALMSPRKRKAFIKKRAAIQAAKYAKGTEAEESRRLKFVAAFAAQKPEVKKERYDRAVAARLKTISKRSKRSRSKIGKKVWETRRANKENTAETAKRGWETRRQNQERLSAAHN